MNLDLLRKFTNNRCSSEEIDRFLEWVQHTDDKSGEVLLRQYWDTLKSEENAPESDSLRLLDRIHHQINIAQSETPEAGIITTPQKKTLFLNVLLRAAVILLIPVITLLVYTRFFQSDYISNIEVISPATSRTFLELADGTKVWLNHGSKLIYPQKFSGKTRTISLTGEGYFDVAHDPSKPFIVEAGAMAVKAIGTSFNVKSYDDGSDFETTLESGKVLIQKKTHSNNSTICTMVPGQHLRFDQATNNFSLETKASFKYVAWKEGKMVFDDDRLDVVVAQLSRWYNVKIVLKDAELSTLTYKATFVDESLSQILEMMQVIMPITCVEVKREKSSDGAFEKKEILIYNKEKM